MKKDKVVLYSSDEAAKKVTVTGWLSSDGRFWGDDEHMARWAGCTHGVCACGNLYPRGYTICSECRAKKERERYYAMPEAEWDGASVLYSEALDEYFTDLDDVRDALYDRPDIDPMLVICKPNYAREIDGDDYFCDEIPEGHDFESIAPKEAVEALDAFNKAMKGVVLSWSPGPNRTTMPTGEQEAHNEKG